MTFPSFVTTGPAVEIPVAPTQYPMLNLMPAIQALRKPKATAASSTKKSKDDQSKIEATRGQSLQWQNEIDTRKSKLNAIINWYGDEAITLPEYKKLINEIDFLDSPGLAEVLKRNKSEVDQYKSNIAEKDASGMIHIGMALKGHGWKTADYWKEYMENAQTADVSEIKPGQNAFLENFESDFQFYDFKDASDEAIKILQSAKTSEKAWDSAWNDIQEFAMGDMAGLLKIYNKESYQYRSNYNRYGEDGKGSKGQLGAARDEVWSRTGQQLGAMDMSDPLTQGIFQGFLQKTISIKRTGKRDSPTEKEALMTRLDLLGEGEEAELERRKNNLDGYYYKEGTIIDGVDVSGQIDQNAFMNDFNRFAEGHLMEWFNMSREQVESIKKDEQYVFYNQNDEQTKGGVARRKADLFATAAVQAETSGASVTDQGYDEKGLMNLFGEKEGEGDKEDQGLFGNLFGGIKDMFGGVAGLFGDSDEKLKATDKELFDAMTSLGQDSPFEVSVGTDQRLTYRPKDHSEFNLEEYKYKLWELVKRKNPDWTDADIDDYVSDMSSRIVKAHNRAIANRYEESNFGLERTYQTYNEWTPDAVPVEIMETLNDTWFNLKDSDGNIKFKRASDLFRNSDVKVGETVSNGSQLLGNIPIVGTKGDLVLQAVSIPSNARVYVNQDIKLGNRTIQAGNAIHITELDALPPAKIKELMSGDKPSLILGTGYWNKVNGKWKDGQNPDRTTVRGSGNNSVTILRELYTVDANNPQYVANAPGQYYTTALAQDKVENVIANLTGKTFMTDVPSYALSATGMESYNYAKSVAQKLHLNMTQKDRQTRQAEFITGSNATGNIQQIENYANALGLTGKNKTDFIKEAQNVKDIAALGGKYYGSQKYKTQKNWSMEPAMAPVPIINEKGKVDTRFKNQTNWEEKNGKVTFEVQANVTGALQNSRDYNTVQYLTSGYNSWSRAHRPQKESTQQQQYLPNTNPKK